MRTNLARIPVIPILAAVALCAACIIAFPHSAWASEFPENDNLSSQQIKDRFHEINSSYEVGEAFCPADEDFVLRYATDPHEPVAHDTNSINLTGSGYGTTVNISGTAYHNGTFTYTYGANVSVTKTAGGTPRSMTLNVHCTSYGIVGSGGVGIIYNDGVSYTGNNTSSFYANPSRSYVGVMTVYYLEVWADVTTSTGNYFTVSA